MAGRLQTMMVETKSDPVIETMRPNPKNLPATHLFYQPLFIRYISFLIYAYILNNIIVTIVNKKCFSNTSFFPSEVIFTVSRFYQGTELKTLIKQHAWLHHHNMLFTCDYVSTDLVTNV